MSFHSIAASGASGPLRAALSQCCLLARLCALAMFRISCSSRLLRLSDDDFSKRPSCFEVPERAPHIVKWKDAIDQRPEPVHRDGTIHLGELSTVSREDDPDRCRSVVQDVDINRWRCTR